MAADGSAGKMRDTRGVSRGTKTPHTRCCRPGRWPLPGTQTSSACLEIPPFSSWASTRCHDGKGRDGGPSFADTVSAKALVGRARNDTGASRERVQHPSRRRDVGSHGPSDHPEHERKTLREKEARGLSRVCALRPPRRSGAGAPPQSPLRPGSRGHPSPWWLGSGQPRLLGGLTPRPPGLPWRRCAGACARSWWPRRGEPCAAEAAGRSPSCPGGRRCAAASAPPATQGESDVSAGTEQTRSVVSA